MGAFRRFDPYAVIDNRESRGIPAKLANPAKAGGHEGRTLATLAALAGSGSETEIPVMWREAEEERAAIVEHNGCIPRAWAEGFARLDSNRPPGDVPPRRWQRFVDDVGLFLDSPFCAVAAALGWGGGDPARPRLGPARDQRQHQGEHGCQRAQHRRNPRRTCFSRSCWSGRTPRRA